MKVICFYLPQYHPTQENNQWWGTGFTEWTNVSRATPRFKGHYQPQLPADLGFYDLRLEETRIAQALLASSYGVSGFCYYHYWFAGKLMLERPLVEMLESGKPEFPFCLCWANEKWIRSWDNETQEILIEQKYDSAEHMQHIEWLLPFLKDTRYINIRGMPVLLIYRAEEIPDLASKLVIWREYAAAHGLPGLYMCAVNNYKNTKSVQELIGLGFNAVVDFQPNARDFPVRKTGNFIRFILPRVANKIISTFKLNLAKMSVTDSFSYARIVDNLAKKTKSTATVFPTAFPSWDNSPRKKVNATVLQNEDPVLFRAMLETARDQVATHPAEEQIVFINAWNEWAEGCHLEPDLKHGHAFLRTVKSVFSRP